jgi:NAD(P)-dependent dehydrogenase (short-subunit alcohol dehydrogenase family)
MMNRSIIVTGGGRGIGAAIAIGAAQHGFSVCVNYERDEDRANSVVARIERVGGKAIAVKADVADEQSVIRLFETSDRELGPLGHLVNNAGIAHLGGGRVDQFTTNTLMRMFGVNVIGSFLCAREAVRRLSTRYGGQGGSIVNISSTAARLGGAGRNVHYAATKGAINSFTRGLAQEVAGEGIRVNAVSPGVTDTEIQPPGRISEVSPTLPFGRAGGANEVAAAVLWLISDDASYVSGANIEVSGAL